VQQQNISVATENPPKSDDWKWSTDKSAFIMTSLEIHALKGFQVMPYYVSNCEKQ
jgi:hypothetical protein